MKNKILLVDNDRDFLEATAILLESDGYDVVRASNGQEGFQRAKEESPDLILLDMMMTYKTEGAEMAKALAADAATHNIPLILITGAKKEMGFPFEIKPDEKDLPVKMVIEKPIQPERLLSTVKLFIKKTGLEHRSFVGEIDALVDKWSGKDGNLVEAEKYYLTDEKAKNTPSEIIDIGLVGKVKAVNTDLIVSVAQNGFIPVIAPTGIGASGETYNINADIVAGEV
ncbi:MAG TPA: response regulator, partial [Candidatus Omnitrophota bacterium]|nr:response regulator [Candidatus Omnitrophota bacterium]